MLLHRSFLSLTLLGLPLIIQPSLGRESSALLSSERSEATPSIIHLKNQQNIHGIVELVENLTNPSNANRIAPHKIAVILDVDGTLTDHSIPTPGESPANTRARDNAPEDVKRLINLGVHLYISSAWNKFEETLGRLRQLGLAEELEISPEPKNKRDKSFFLKGHYKCPTNKRPYIYRRKGKVISAQWTDGKDQIFFRQKALTPYIGLRATFGKEVAIEKANLIKTVIFADDSAGNITYFQQDIQENNLFPNADQIFTFELTGIRHGKSTQPIQAPKNPLAKSGVWDIRKYGILLDESETSEVSSRSTSGSSPLPLNASQSEGFRDYEGSSIIANLRNEMGELLHSEGEKPANAFAARTRYEHHLQNTHASPVPKSIYTGVNVRRLAEHFK
jgi:hypothetical protein